MHETPAPADATGEQPSTATTATTATTTTIQSSAAKDALVQDVQRILENDAEIALITNRREPFYAKRLQTELSRRYNWDVSTDLVTTAVDELGWDTVKRCAQLHIHG